ncbi:uncharacterized protein [Typha angustifolia]|uniref:uncharacterized protein isoform X1 n=1 Tax=Typha angustifolia TaxID=59011 RepID=UPI003C2FB6BB
MAVYRSLRVCLELQSRCFLSRGKRGFKSVATIGFTPCTQIKKAQKFSSLRKLEKDETNLCRYGACGNESDSDRLFDAQMMKSSPILKQVELLSDYEDDTDTTAEFLETSFSNESEVLSFEGAHITRRNEISRRTLQDAEKAAIELLAVRAFTAAELRKKLRGKMYPCDVVDAVIDDIKNRGLLNDGLYAESFSRSRWLSSTWGPKRIKQALIQKGVTEAEADKATRKVFEDDDNNNGSDNYTEHGMSQTSFDRLFLQTSKQWLRGQGLSIENRKIRVVRWLQYRGFNWRVTNIILRRLESQYPP